MRCPVCGRELRVVCLAEPVEELAEVVADPEGFHVLEVVHGGSVDGFRAWHVVDVRGRGEYLLVSPRLCCGRLERHPTCM